MKITIRVLRVFVNEKGQFGNPVGIVIDERQEIDSKKRQQITAKINFSETVFIDKVKTGSIQLFNPKKEVAFAGHALVGTSYFLNGLLYQHINTLICKIGKVQTWQDDNLTWIRANLEGTPPWHHKQFANAQVVNNLSSKKFTEHTFIWSWIDENKGIIRARTFAPDWGIPEDEANGSGSMQLASNLNRKLEIHHGKGSIIYASPEKFGIANVGGRVKEHTTSEITL